MTDTYVRARIDEQLKNEANHLLNALGLSMSDFIRIALTRVVLERGVPFEMKIPNAETRAVMDDIIARHTAPNFNSVGKQFEDLERELENCK